MSNDTNTEDQLVKGILIHGVDILENCLCSDDLSKYIERVLEEKLDYPLPKSKVDINIWFIPKEYQDLNIEEFLVNNCPEENYPRLIKELELYQEQNFIPVLKVMKYIVDTLRENGILWGVGRGSSVASYVLYLIGVHKIDSVKYNLPIEEFFKGEQNG